MIVSNLIKASMRKMGLVAAGENPSPEELADGLEALQLMLRALASKKVLVFASMKESFNLISGQASYSWGSGGNITTTRPYQVLEAFVKDSGGSDHPVRIISSGGYDAIQSKTTAGRPERIYYHPSYPLAYLYTYPVAQDVEAMWIDSLKPFTETSSFSSISDTISFPPNYEEPMVYALALRLAPEYGKTMSAEALAVASSSSEGLTILNAANQVEPISPSLPVGMKSSYNINEG